MLRRKGELGLTGYDPDDAHLSAIATVGAESAMAAAYFAGRVDVSRDRLIDHITELHLAAAGITTADAGAARLRGTDRGGQSQPARYCRLLNPSTLSFSPEMVMSPAWTTVT